MVLLQCNLMKSIWWCPPLSFRQIIIITRFCELIPSPFTSKRLLAMVTTVYLSHSIRHTCILGTAKLLLWDTFWKSQEKAKIHLISIRPRAVRLNGDFDIRWPRTSECLQATVLASDVANKTLFAFLCRFVQFRWSLIYERVASKKRCKFPCGIFLLISIICWCCLSLPRLVC